MSRLTYKIDSRGFQSTNDFPHSRSAPKCYKSDKDKAPLETVCMLLTDLLMLYLTICSLRIADGSMADSTCAVISSLTDFVKQVMIAVDRMSIASVTQTSL